jgi:thioredoxin 2
LAWIVDAGDADFAEIAEKATIPVLLDLWATSRCAPRRQVSRVLAQLAHEKAGDVKVVKIDIDSAQTRAQRFDVQDVSMLMVMRHGEVIARQTGAAPAALLQEWLEGTIVPSAAAADGTRI